jgi:serine/threonine-protein kinase
MSRRFRLVRRLGQGGMGTVFLAEQIGVGNRRVALKVLNRKLLDDPDFLLRFQNEAGSTGRIHHANVVTIYESAQADDGTPYIAMEFLEGESLRQVLTRRGALPLPEVAEIVRQAARGLNAAHRLGIIHRDLKPDNIFLTRGDEGELVVKVVDFGIAKLCESAAHTQTGMVLGTPAYMSCEQASGMRSDELDARSDIYSLGVVVYEMLTGRVPFNSDTPLGYLRKHMLEEPPPFRAIAQGLGVPPAVESAVMRALAKDRDQRYGSALDFDRELTSAAQLSPPAETPVPFPSTLIVSPPAAESSQPLPSTRVVLSPTAQELDAPVRRPSSTPAQADTGVETPPSVPPGRIGGAPSAQPQGSKPATAKPPHLQGTERSSRVKYIVLGLALLAVIAGGIWYFSRPREQPSLNVKSPSPGTTVPAGQEARVEAPLANLGPTAAAAKVNPKDGLKYVWIPPGTFMMGCSPGDSKCEGDEKPPHQVTITKGYWLGQTEVTVRAYSRFVESTGAQMPATPNFNATNDQDMPIVNIRWDDASTFCGWAGGRLPTEAEWEYAARAGSMEARYGPIDDVAWYANNSGQKTHEVGQKRANAFGLYDILGNVWEWVNDWYDPKYYQNSPSQDPKGPTSGRVRVIRGGSWSDDPGHARVSYRPQSRPGHGYPVLGFRCGGEVFTPSVPQKQIPQGGVSAPAVGLVRENPKDGLKYVWIPPGTFQMGCSPGDNECTGGEKPSHQVTITKGFWLGQTEATVGAYKRFAAATGAQMPPEERNLVGGPPNPGWGDEAMPIVDVTWYDATAFCRWVGGRLPTEAEWEYAVRGGSTTAQYGPIDEVAWYVNNSGGKVHEVGQKRANAFGLYDMLGNASEWVNDLYDFNYYKHTPSQDPPGPASGDGRVQRGGSSGQGSAYVRVSDRNSANPGQRFQGYGFRCGGEVFGP